MVSWWMYCRSKDKATENVSKVNELDPLLDIKLPKGTHARMKQKILTTINLLVFGILQLNAQEKPTASEYPKIVGYLAVVHPLLTIDKDGFSSNFTNYYHVGFPTGIHVYSSKNFGYSLEIVPFIKVINGEASANNILIHPGLIFRFPQKWTLYTRLAFETSGRFGLTPAISKVVYKSNHHNFFITVPFPLRLGNKQSASFGIALLGGLTF
ncbi:MAG: hypothetical protein KA767_01665 [Saprospiraceae bacterium]|nr:hypothetical protein [Candidatus Vicinibacter affinis]MBP7642011.1 hypothetical protein [Saprospiraceae bacterium]